MKILHTDNLVKRLTKSAKVLALVLALPTMQAEAFGVSLPSLSGQATFTQVASMVIRGTSALLRFMYHHPKDSVTTIAAGAIAGFLGRQSAKREKRLALEDTAKQIMQENSIRYFKFLLDKRGGDDVRFNNMLQDMVRTSIDIIRYLDKREADSGNAPETIVTNREELKQLIQSLDICNQPDRPLSPQELSEEVIKRINTNSSVEYVLRQIITITELSRVPSQDEDTSYNHIFITLPNIFDITFRASELDLLEDPKEAQDLILDVIKQINDDMDAMAKLKRAQAANKAKDKLNQAQADNETADKLNQAQADNETEAKLKQAQTDNETADKLNQAQADNETAEEYPQS